MTYRAIRFSRFAWAVTGYYVLVILWGAWVRITGSGAGCGDRWPSCGGEVIPRSPSAKTLIEFLHRGSSGIALILGIVCLVWARRLFPRGHRARLGAGVALGFLLLEAAIGAVLVKLHLVENDDSVARAVVIAVHLVNTFTLNAFAALTAWWAAGDRGPIRWRGGGSEAVWLGAGLLATLLTGMTGAVTALGDTLFPVAPIADGGLWAHLSGDLSPAVHFLVRLRVVHPVVAGAAALLLISLAVARWQSPWARALAVLVGLEAGLGILNVVLAAPGWLQIGHLALANGCWLALVMLAATQLARAEGPAVGPV